MAMAKGSAIESDYLVVGAGALRDGLADTLIQNSDADVVMIDGRHGPGDHWLDSYPFVQLHQPSMNYGVNSTALGEDRTETDGRDAGFYERAGGGRPAESVRDCALSALAKLDVFASPATPAERARMFQPVA
jgi:hypothetical protein